MTRSEVTAYIDFLCPWAYRGSLWLADVEKAGRIHVTWRFFSLSQNHQAHEGPAGPPVWETKREAPGLPAFLAATAARAQGEDASNQFREGLQRARHEDHQRLDDPRTHHQVAERAGLDVARWERDLASATFETLAREHQEAVAKGVFGVPTLIWPEGRSYYIKLTDLVTAERAVSLYDAVETVQRFAEVVEIKTPESEGTLAA